MLSSRRGLSFRRGTFIICLLWKRIKNILKSQVTGTMYGQLVRMFISMMLNGALIGSGKHFAPMGNQWTCYKDMCCIQLPFKKRVCIYIYMYICPCVFERVLFFLTSPTASISSWHQPPQNISTPT